jgi:thiol-disulfide isomerase/thioredoxin
MKKYGYLLLSILLIGLVACSTKTPPPREGSRAPEFVLKDLEGREVSLSSLKGNVVLVNFWATWCPPCREEIPSMAKLNALVAGKPVRLLAISIDEGGKAAVENLFRKMNVTLPTLLDTDSKTGKRYGITGVPETFIVDRQGYVVKKVVGPMDWADPQIVKFLDELTRR